MHLLSGLSLILDARERSRPFWIHLIWTNNVFVLAVVTWWRNFSIADIPTWSFFHYANLVAYAVLVYVLAGLLFPTRGPEVVDFRLHFERNRTWFFLVLAGFTPVDVFNGLLEGAAGATTHFSRAYFLFIGGSLVGSIVGALTRKGLYHGLFGIAWPISLMIWVWLEYAWIVDASGS